MRHITIPEGWEELVSGMNEGFMGVRGEKREDK